MKMNLWKNQRKKLKPIKWIGRSMRVFKNFSFRTTMTAIIWSTLIGRQREKKKHCTKNQKRNRFLRIPKTLMSIIPFRILPITKWFLHHLLKQSSHRSCKVTTEQDQKPTRRHTYPTGVTMRTNRPPKVHLMSRIHFYLLKDIHYLT